MPAPAGNNYRCSLDTTEDLRLVKRCSNEADSIQSASSAIQTVSPPQSRFLQGLNYIISILVVDFIFKDGEVCVGPFEGEGYVSL